MTRAVYVNGEYCAYDKAHVHVEDRGYQFADGVYEVCEVRNGKLIDERLHMRRLVRSMSELKMKAPMDIRALGVVMRETVRRNRVRDGMVYVQITRGTAQRDFVFQDNGIPGSVVCFARKLPRQAREARAARGLAIITMPDIRWRRPDIKTVGLLPNTLAKQAAKDAGADDAWFVASDGTVTEGASSNAWIVNGEGTLITHPANCDILRGVTREVLLALAARSGYNVEERAFTVEEAKTASEAFSTSAAALVMPVVSIDGVKIANGLPGALTMKLRAHFHDAAEASPEWQLLPGEALM
jgi:D-alanine transaminase